MHVVALGLLLGQHLAGERPGRLGRVVQRRLVPPPQREVGEPRPCLVEGVLVVDGEVVAAARDRGVHASPTHLLERGDLADHHLGHAGRPQVHRGVALDHDHDVAEARDVGAAGGRRPEQAADLGHPPRQPHLVVEDPPGTAPPGEELDLVGDAGAGRVDQPEHRQLVGQRLLGQPHDLLDRARSPRAGLHRRIVGHDAHRSAVDRAGAGHHAVGGEVVGGGVRQQAVLDERAGVDQQVDAVADEQLALLGQLGRPLGEVAGQGPLGGRRQHRLVDGALGRSVGGGGAVRPGGWRGWRRHRRWARSRSPRRLRAGSCTVRRPTPRDHA